MLFISYILERKNSFEIRELQHLHEPADYVGLKEKHAREDNQGIINVSLQTPNGTECVKRIVQVERPFRCKVLTTH